MGATAQERLEKRRINELEEKLKTLQREMQSYKAKTKKQVGKLRKDVRRASDMEDDMTEQFEDELAQDRNFSSNSTKEPAQQTYRCRKEKCKSDDIILVPAGIRVIVLCKTCEGKYTIPAKEYKNAG